MLAAIAITRVRHDGNGMYCVAALQACHLHNGLWTVTQANKTYKPYICCHALDCTDTNGIINLQTKEINSLETATLLIVVAVAAPLNFCRKFLVVIASSPSALLLHEANLCFSPMHVVTILYRTCHISF